MTDPNPYDAPRQTRDEQDKPDTGVRILRKRAHVSAPMPVPSPYEQRIKDESKRLIELYGRRKRDR